MKIAMPSAALIATMVALGSVDASAGPCTREIEELSKQLSASDAGTGPTKGAPAPTASDQKGQHPPTALMNRRSADKATSPADVRRQSGIKAEASSALARARTLDAQGKSECKSALKRAKELSAL
jgi:hypothetical protein